MSALQGPDLAVFSFVIQALVWSKTQDGHNGKMYVDEDMGVRERENLSQHTLGHTSPSSALHASHPHLLLPDGSYRPQSEYPVLHTWAVPTSFPCILSLLNYFGARCPKVVSHSLPSFLPVDFLSLVLPPLQGAIQMPHLQPVLPAAHL